MDVLKFLTVSDRNHSARDADVAQVVAHLIGNEEVGSSSLLVSSVESASHVDADFFVYLGNCVSYYTKTLRGDRTAAERKMSLK